MGKQGKKRGRQHRPAASPKASKPASPEPSRWRQARVKIIAGAVAVVGLLGSIIGEVVKNALTDVTQKTVHHIGTAPSDGKALRVTLLSRETPHPGCDALQRPLTPQDRAAVSLGSGIEEMTARHGVASVGKLSIQLHLFAGSDAQVTISRMQVVRTAARPSLNTALLCVGNAGVNGSFQLRGTTDGPLAVTDMREDGATYGQRHWISLKPKESLNNNIVISATARYAEFHLRVSYLKNGRPQPAIDVYDSGGAPFRITGAAASYQDVYHSDLGGDYRPGYPSWWKKPAKPKA